MHDKRDQNYQKQYVYQIQLSDSVLEKQAEKEQEQYPGSFNVPEAVILFIFQQTGKIQEGHKTKIQRDSDEHYPQINHAI